MCSTLGDIIGQSLFERRLKTIEATTANKKTQSDGLLQVLRTFLHDLTVFTCRYPTTCFEYLKKNSILIEK